MSEVSATKRASEASCLKQENERTDERVAQYFSLYFWLFWPTVRPSSDLAVFLDGVEMVASLFDVLRELWGLKGSVCLALTWPYSWTVWRW